MTRMAKLMARLELEVNTTKADQPGCLKMGFDFLGYDQSLRRNRALLFLPAVAEGGEELAQAHHRRTTLVVSDEPASTVAHISSMLRGWCGLL